MSEDKYVMQGTDDSFVVEFDDFDFSIGDEVLMSARVWSFISSDTEEDQEVEFCMTTDEVRKLRDWLSEKLEEEEEDNA